MKTFWIIIIVSVVLSVSGPVVAVNYESDPAAKLVVHEVVPDARIQKLRTYLQNQESPLAKQADIFVAEADRHNLDWKLVAAIAGVESTFGKHIPSGSFNAWGWGIPTGAQSGIGFKNWEHGIATVSEGLAKNYFGRGAKTIYDVGRIYAANGISWGNHVLFFMSKIDSFELTSPDLLPVSI